MGDDSVIVDLPDMEATFAFGKQLAALLFPNAVVALVGNLGAGKTHLTRAIAIGLGVKNQNLVTSPTFVLIQEYAARLPIYHFDAYRLSGPEAFLQLGAEEYFIAGGVCLIEWADRVKDALPDSYLRIDLESISEVARRATLTAVGNGYANFCATFGRLVQ